MYTPKNKGGLGLPDLQKYFYAAQLAQPSRFHSQQPHAIWMDMESYSCHPEPIFHIMWLSMKERPTILYPILSVSLEIRDRLTRTQKFKSPHNPLAPLLKNREFTPGLNPHTFEWWTNKGLIRIADLCDHKGMVSERILIDKYKMPPAERYRFTQIHHSVQTVARKGGLVTLTPMEHLCKQYDKIRGHISAIYTIMMYDSTKLNYMKHWEQDFQETLDLEEWHAISETASRSLINTSHYRG